MMYNLIIDIDDCASNPCKNDGECVDKVNDFECQCKPGFTGKDCNEGKLYNVDIIAAI